MGVALSDRFVDIDIAFIYPSSEGCKLHPHSTARSSLLLFAANTQIEKEELKDGYKIDLRNNCAIVQVDRMMNKGRPEQLIVN